MPDIHCAEVIKKLKSDVFTADIKFVVFASRQLLTEEKKFLESYAMPVVLSADQTALFAQWENLASEATA